MLSLLTEYLWLYVAYPIRLGLYLVYFETEGLWY